jgi:histone acetyltransferase (RNA polymerase elongator complex component)
MKFSKPIFHELFSYDSKTGKIFQQQKRPNVKIGEIAGTITPKGYRYIQAKGRKYPAHHLVWYFETGSFPNLFIDHIDGNKLNNHFSNLREVTTKQNNEHRGKQKNNSTGYKGVTFNKRLEKFIAQIQHNSKQLHIGTFDTALEASQAYEQKAKSLFSHY